MCLRKEACMTYGNDVDYDTLKISHCSSHSLTWRWKLDIICSQFNMMNHPLPQCNLKKLMERKYLLHKLCTCHSPNYLLQFLATRARFKCESNRRTDKTKFYFYFLVSVNLLKIVLELTRLTVIDISTLFLYATQRQRVNFYTFVLHVSGLDHFCRQPTLWKVSSLVHVTDFFCIYSTQRNYIKLPLDSIPKLNLQFKISVHIGRIVKTSLEWLTTYYIAVK